MWHSSLPYLDGCLEGMEEYLCTDTDRLIKFSDIFDFNMDKLWRFADRFLAMRFCF
jgi:hypothetical protein